MATKKTEKKDEKKPAKKEPTEKTKKTAEKKKTGAGGQRAKGKPGDKTAKAAAAKAKVKKEEAKAAQTGEKNKGGRPEKEVDQSLFERLCGIQCTKLEICAVLRIDDVTLDRWCGRTYGKGFSEVFEEKRGEGKVALRRAMWVLAQNTPSVAIFLAKNWLGMSDKQQVDVGGTMAVIGTGYPGAREEDKKIVGGDE